MTVLGTFCGDIDIDGEMISPENGSFHMEFMTDVSRTFDGFRLRYSFIGKVTALNVATVLGLAYQYTWKRSIPGYFLSISAMILPD